MLHHLTALERQRNNLNLNMIVSGFAQQSEDCALPITYQELLIAIRRVSSRSGGA